MNAKTAQKRIKLRCKREGSVVTVKYMHWPDGKPEADGWGATPAGAQTPEVKTFSSRCFIHAIEPITSGVRKFAEVKPGNKILDFALGWVRVTDGGDTDLEVGDVMDTTAFNAANRALESGETPATSVETTVFELDRPSFVIKGQEWVQSEIGEELLKDWDAIYASLELSLAILVRRK